MDKTDVHKKINCSKSFEGEGEAGMMEGESGKASWRKDCWS